MRAERCGELQSHKSSAERERRKTSVEMLGQHSPLEGEICWYDEEAAHSSVMGKRITHTKNTGRDIPPPRTPAFHFFLFLFCGELRRSSRPSPFISAHYGGNRHDQRGLMSSAEMRAPRASSPSQDRGGSAPQSQRALSPPVPSVTCFNVKVRKLCERAPAQILVDRFETGAFVVYGSFLLCWTGRTRFFFQYHPSNILYLL